MYRLVRFIFIVFTFVSFSSMASVTESGTLSRLIIEGNVVSIWVNGVDDKSECSGGDRWVLLKSDSLFQEKYSALLMAFASGKEVILHSTGTCPTFNANGIYYVYLRNI